MKHNTGKAFIALAMLAFVSTMGFADDVNLENVRNSTVTGGDRLLAMAKLESKTAIRGKLLFVTQTGYSDYPEMMFTIVDDFSPYSRQMSVGDSGFIRFILRERPLTRNADASSAEAIDVGIAIEMYERNGLDMSGKRPVRIKYVVYATSAEYLRAKI